MEKPTPEQIQWLWEQCGLKPAHPNCRISGHMSIPDESGNWWCRPIEVDLNNLFKYAVPKTLEKLGKLKTVELVNNAVCDAVENKGEIADSLFWAIYKALGGKDGS